MQRPSSFTSFPQDARVSGSSARASQGAVEFLHSHEKVAALLPTARRMVELQKECAAILPGILQQCTVMKFEAGQLVLSLPNAALAARLKQQVPQLRLALVKRGWQVNSIQIKVQVTKYFEESICCEKTLLPDLALASLQELRDSLGSSPRNEALKTALNIMIKRHQQKD